MSRIFFLALLLVLVPAPGRTADPPKGSRAAKNSRVWTIHFQEFQQPAHCVWPEAATNDDSSYHRIFPLLRASHRDSVLFVIDNGPDSCRVLFHSNPPLARASKPDSTVAWIDVFRAGDPRNLFYVVAKSHPTGKWCRSWYDVLAAHSAFKAAKPDSCRDKDPGDLGHMGPCSMEGSIRQIGPGMDTAD